MEDMQPGRIISPTPQDHPSNVPDGQQTYGSTQPQETSVVSSAPDMPPIQPETTQMPQPLQEAVPQIAPENPVDPPAPQPTSPVPPPIVDEHPAMPAHESSLTWSAAEYMHHEKHVLWYGLYILGTLLLSAVVYFTTKDIMSTSIVFVAILGLVLFASRKPGVQECTIGADYLKVGQKVYYLHDFKAFSVVEEGAVAEITLHPLKRFLPMVSVYVNPEQVDVIGDFLADFLPFEPYKPDAVDTLLRHIRF
jgi:hypothetical protein